MTKIKSQSLSLFFLQKIGQTNKTVVENCTALAKSDMLDTALTKIKQLLKYQSILSELTELLFVSGSNSQKL